MTLQNIDIQQLEDMFRRVVREELESRGIGVKAEPTPEVAPEKETIDDEHFEEIVDEIFTKYKTVLDALA